MKWPHSLTLPPRARKVLLVLVCVGAVSLYTARVATVYLAQQAADSYQKEDQRAAIERAMRLVPDDAEYPHVLGLRLSALDEDDGAIANLRKAVTLNPNGGRYWLDLASVYQVTGKGTEENEAVQSALNAEPGNPAMAAEAAQFFLVAGDSDRAMPLFKQALEKDPDAAATILPVCWRETHDAKSILANAIPANPVLQLDFLRMLTWQKQADAAREVWNYVVAAHQYFSPQPSFFYFDYLLKEHDVAGFNRGWHELADLAPEMRAYLPAHNLIVNSGFELPLLNSGFDWRHEPADHIAAGLDDKIAHSGRHSLSLTYDGSPVYEAGWTEFVPVEANAEYDFSAWIKSDNVTSSSGPRIALVDAFSDSVLLMTDDVLDTHNWREIKGTLRVPASTELLAVKITRAPANTRIRGRIWIDDLQLVRK